jgi:two-component system sensor histidine kinase SenX3
LAIVKHVAANHGGDVQLWSKPGTGSTFTLRIPAHTDSPQRAPRTPSIPEHVGGSL